MKKEKEIDLTEESLQRRLKELREYYLNDPTIQYKIGDRVERGRIKQTIITEVIDNGKIYKVHEICTNDNYGRPFDYERDDYVFWCDLLPYRENKPIKNMVQDQDLEIHYSQRTIESIIHTSYNSGIDTEVDYQRGNIWELLDKEKLIDSIFKNIEIGKFALIRIPWKHKGKLYEMIDGKQRLTALIEFFENRFAYNGVKFYELSSRDQSHFENYPLQWGELSNEQNEITNEQKYRYFLRLNTAGKLQDLKHIQYVEELLKKVK